MSSSATLIKTNQAEGPWESVRVTERQQHCCAETSVSGIRMNGDKVSCGEEEERK